MNKPDFQTCYFNVANDEQNYAEFVVSQHINSRETDNRILFKIIHLKSKTNSDRLLMLQKSFAIWIRIIAQKQVEIRKRELEQLLERATEQSEQSGSGTKSRAKVKPKFLLGQ